ncbi:UDP-glucose 4-epimerase GalE [Allorhizocola rhizosphaerae]|uniref:UDP-glucose 4-epimerase GalE n=1 Tax=Allorhizocola rhizosphaerae TaxID=1872709 RepID=UPI000E3E6736|nr:UDP-glucose 4-epimerase GalE [Allorhizocola rhizosphaerae]
MTEPGVWLVTGGAGYIGGHTVARLLSEGRRVVVLDDLSTGLAHRLPVGVPLVNASVLDTDAVAGALREHAVSGVIHFAAKKSVPESMADPLLYYREIVGGTTSLLTAMREAGVGRLVYSSTAAVYGMPKQGIVRETDPAVPISPYGHSKLVSEQVIREVGRAHELSWLSLRYFNAVGADTVGLADHGASNLFPRIFRAFAQGRPVVVTGGDFDTPDGTGVRDYIHVGDLADAHVAAVHRLERGPAAAVLNVGTGRGYSVLEVLAAFREITGEDVPYEIVAPRAGDPATVIASVDRIAEELGWSARRDLKEMVASAWAAVDLPPPSPSGPPHLEKV